MKTSDPKKAASELLRYPLFKCRSLTSKERKSTEYPNIEDKSIVLVSNPNIVVYYNCLLENYVWVLHYQDYFWDWHRTILSFEQVLDYVDFETRDQLLFHFDLFA
jgi:hypothetical protein